MSCGVDTTGGEMLIVREMSIEPSEGLVDQEYTRIFVLMANVAPNPSMDNSVVTAADCRLY